MVQKIFNRRFTMKKYQSFTAVLLLLTLLFGPACSQQVLTGGGSGKTVDPVVYSGSTMRTSVSFENMVFNGKEIYDDVVDSYDSVLAFYGVDEQLFKDMVNKNLSSSSDNSLSGPFFNYEATVFLKETEFVIEYEDGTKVTLPGVKPLDENGHVDPSWYEALKKGHKYISMAGEVPSPDSILGTLDGAFDSALNIESDFLRHGALEAICNAAYVVDDLREVFDVVATVASFAGPVGMALSVASFFMPSGPSADEVIMKKLDYIADLIKGIYDHLDYIETRLEKIEETIQEYQAQNLNMNLKDVIDEINSQIQEMNDSVTPETKLEIANGFRGYINGKIAKFIRYSGETYAIAKKSEYIDFLKSKDDYEEEYKDIVCDLKPVKIEISTPFLEKYGFFEKSDLFNEFNDTYRGENPSAYTPPYPGGDPNQYGREYLEYFHENENNVFSDSTDCIEKDFLLTSFEYNNPNIYLKMSNESLQYLSNLILTRINMNSLIYEDQALLDEYNANVCDTYLSVDEYIPTLKTWVDETYTNMSMDRDEMLENLDTTSKNLERLVDTFANQWKYNSVVETITIPSYGGPPQVKDMATYQELVHKTVNSNEDGFGYKPAGILGLVPGGMKTIEVDQTLYQETLLPDNPFTLFKTRSRQAYEYAYPDYDDPYVSIEHYPLYIRDIEPSRLVNTVSHEFLEGDITIDGEYVCSTLNLASDPGMLADAKTILDKHYKKKASGALEFAAGLAALEIQLRFYTHNQ
jgi:hypothetical protein